MAAVDRPDDSDQDASHFLNCGQAVDPNHAPRRGAAVVAGNAPLHASRNDAQGATQDLRPGYSREFCRSQDMVRQHAAASPT